MKHKLFVCLRAIGIVLLSAVGLVLLAAAAVFLLPLTEAVDGTEAAGSADWMADLDDGMPLSEITLPGTHNSGAEHAQLAFFSKCQSMGIKEQLEAGYRYLDIRLDGDEGVLRLMHGFTECKPSALSNRALTLSEVLGDCYAFLEEHSTETVLFCVKQEHGDLPVADLQRMLAEEIRRDPERWLLTDALPTLGEARGKIVLLRRWEDDAGLGSDAGVPFGWKDQGGTEYPPEDTEANFPGELLVWVQDRYEYDTEEKWEAFVEGLTVGVGEEEAALHFLSTKGSFAYGHPYFFAQRLNKRLLAYELPGEGPLGWVIVDFGSARLVEHIYERNFR